MLPQIVIECCRCRPLVIGPFTGVLHVTFVHLGINVPIEHVVSCAGKMAKVAKQNRFVPFGYLHLVVVKLYVRLDYLHVVCRKSASLAGVCHVLIIIMQWTNYLRACFLLFNNFLVIF